MESGGQVSEENWSSFNATMPVDESELMTQLLGTNPLPLDQVHDSSFGISSMFWTDNPADSYCCPQDVNPNLPYWPQENFGSISTTYFSVPSTEYGSCYPSEYNVVPEISGSSLPADFCMMEEQINTPALHVVPSNSYGDHFCLNEEPSNDFIPQVLHDRNLEPKRKFQMGEDDNDANKLDIPTESPKKKARAPSKVQKSSKNTKPKKGQKSRSVDEDESNTRSSCYSSDEDESIASQELTRGTRTSSSSKGSSHLTLSGKTRAGRGSATDPQSLYARKRRERINERLRILQNLVPNGTKVDISTMLEEAVQYVKFLQLQIKLLSSDEMWMYAPIAYNGINIGLDLNFTPK